MAVIEARFAGGHIEVSNVAPATLETTQFVEVVLPGAAVTLWPDEARRLAITLIEAASDAERPEPPEWP
jgi:hypothetical protein